MFRLSLLQGLYAVCKLDEWPVKAPIGLEEQQIYSLTRNGSEVSLVCPKELAPQSAIIENDWRAFVVAGPLDFSLVGVLASLTDVLAKASVSLFSISTYDTDIILVKQADLDVAKQALSKIARLTI